MYGVKINKLQFNKYYSKSICTQKSLNLVLRGKNSEFLLIII